MKATNRNEIERNKSRGENFEANLEEKMFSRTNQYGYMFKTIGFMVLVVHNVELWLHLRSCQALRKLDTDHKKKDWIEQPIVPAPTKLKPVAPSCWDHFRDKAKWVT